MMKRRECFELLAKHRKGELVVVNLGLSAYDWFDTTRSDDSFYQWSGLGQVSSFGLGLALALPHRGVWVLDGDGSLTINLGTLITTAAAAPSNLTHFLMLNREWGTCGGHDLVGADIVDFAAIARGAGIRTVCCFSDFSRFRDQIGDVLASPGHKFIILEIEKGGDGNDQDFRYDPVEMKYRFVRSIEQQENLSLLGPWVKSPKRAAVGAGSK